MFFEISKSAVFCLEFVPMTRFCLLTVSAALLFAKDGQGISITGDGIMDGQDRAVWQRLADEEAGGDVTKPGWWPQAFCGDWWPFGKRVGERGGRPRMILLLGCQQAAPITIKLLIQLKFIVQGQTLHWFGSHEG